jgi:hypothetical protein
LKTVAEWAAMMEHDLAQHPECPRSGFRFVSNMIGVAAIAAHRTSLRSALTSKQVRRDSDRNLDCFGREPVGDAVSQHNHAIN